PDKVSATRDKACSPVRMGKTTASTHSPTVTSWRSWGGIRASRVSFTVSSRRMVPTRGRWAKRLPSTTAGAGVAGDCIHSSMRSYQVLKLLKEDRRIAPANGHPLRKNHRFPYMTLECRLADYRLIRFAHGPTRDTPALLPQQRTQPQRYLVLAVDNSRIRRQSRRQALGGAHWQLDPSDDPRRSGPIRHPGTERGSSEELR